MVEHTSFLSSFNSQCVELRKYEHHLQGRLMLWDRGDVNQLMIEARTIPNQLEEAAELHPSNSAPEDNARKNASLVSMES